MSEIKYPRNRFLKEQLPTPWAHGDEHSHPSEIEGYENYPNGGGLIVVANHSGLLETV